MTATLLSPKRILLLISTTARAPMAVALVSPPADTSAKAPTAVLLVPVVLWKRAPAPVAVLVVLVIVKLPALTPRKVLDAPTGAARGAVLCINPSTSTTSCVPLTSACTLTSNVHPLVAGSHSGTATPLAIFSPATAAQLMMLAPATACPNAHARRSPAPDALTPTRFRLPPPAPPRPPTPPPPPPPLAPPPA